MFPGMSATDAHWRIAVTSADNDGHIEQTALCVTYASAMGIEFAGLKVASSTDVEQVAEAILAALPDLAAGDK